MRLVVLGLVLGAAGLLAGCATTAAPPVPPAASQGAAAPAAVENPVPPRARLRWQGISDERPPWLRDLPERIERFRAPEDSTRASAPPPQAAIRS